MYDQQRHVLIHATIYVHLSRIYLLALQTIICNNIIALFELLRYAFII